MFTVFVSTPTAALYGGQADNLPAALQLGFNLLADVPGATFDVLNAQGQTLVSNAVRCRTGNHLHAARLDRAALAQLGEVRAIDRHGRIIGSDS